MTPEPTSCPHCDGELSLGFVAQLTEKSRLSMRLVPAEGQLLQAKTLGGTLIEFANLLAAIGDGLDLTSTVCVENVTTDADGAITITVIAARLEKGQ